MRGQPPLRQRNLAALKDGTDRHRERAFAGIAVEQTGAMLLALDLGDTLRHAAMRAVRAVRPANRLKGLAGGVLVIEDRILQIGRHVRLRLMKPFCALTASFVKY